MAASAPKRIVLDTSLFVNPDTQHYFGRDIKEAVQHFLRLAKESGIELYMPISIYRELSHFADADNLAAFRREATVRAPDRHSIQVPATILHSFVGDLRDRVNRGLRIMERAIRSENEPSNVRWVRARIQYNKIFSLYERPRRRRTRGTMFSGRCAGKGKFLDFLYWQWGPLKSYVDPLIRSRKSFSLSISTSSSFAVSSLLPGFSPATT